MSPGRPRRSVEEVLDAVRAIPEGFVRTYGDLSPGAPRFTGAVLRGVGDEVPWWRVVHADGTLAVGEEQRRRLEAEGAPFLRGQAGAPGHARGAAAGGAELDGERCACARSPPAAITARPVPRRRSAIATNASSALGSTSASRLATSAARTPSRIRLTGSSSFFPVSVRGIAGTTSTESGMWRGESDARSAAAMRARSSSSTTALGGRREEQDQLARPALRVLQVHDQAVGDLREGLDDGVELAGSQPHAAAVERRVRAPGDHAAASLA